MLVALAYLMMVLQNIKQQSAAASGQPFAIGNESMIATKKWRRRLTLDKKI
jgi:hypothetical protein